MAPTPCAWPFARARPGQRQIDLDRRNFEEFKNFANKVWNGARFVFLNLEENDPLPGLSTESLLKGLSPKLFTLDDRWILSVLNRTINDLHKHLTDNAFDRAADRAYTFFWNDFCSQYLELAKPVLSGRTGSAELRENKQKILAIVLMTGIRLLHPIAPFVTEEIFFLMKRHFLNLQPSRKKTDAYTRDLIKALLSPACIKAPYPEPPDEADISPEIESTIEKMFRLVYAVRNIRAEMQLPAGEKQSFIFLARRKTRISVQQRSIRIFCWP